MRSSNDMHHMQPIPLTSLEQTSTHSVVGTNTTGTGSSNQDIEPMGWPDEDTLMLQCSTSSNDGDDEHDIMGHNHEDLHLPMQMMPGTSTIIYV